MSDGKAQLEQIFGGVSGKILDHLILCRGMDFTLKELIEIYELSETTVRVNLKHLLDLGLIHQIVIDDMMKFTLDRNDRTELLTRFAHEMAFWQMDRITKAGGSSS